ncbi:MAG: hypothetical protein AAGG07_06120 [Planctomycetota bacterium]
MTRINARLALAAILVIAPITGCSTEGVIIGATAGAVATTAYLGATPGNEIEQVYYLGVLDPQEQVPPAIYRVTVRGQSSAISSTKFASGWVRSDLVDSLQSSASFDENGGGASVSGNALGGSIASDRRLVMFGPEGFREAPKDHRLVIMMGSNPDAYFRAVDSALGVIAQAELKERDGQIAAEIAGLQSRLSNDARRVSELALDLSSMGGN